MSVKHDVVLLGQIVRPLTVDTAPLKISNYSLIIMAAFDANLMFEAVTRPRNYTSLDYFTIWPRAIID